MRVRYWMAGLAYLGFLFSSYSAVAQIPDPLAKINHIFVIFDENRSFDSLFGDFPGANGRANAGDAARQIGPDGTPYEYLPTIKDTNQRLLTIDMRFPVRVPNGPFNLAPYVPPSGKTGDLVHKFYQEQIQINGGAMNRFAAISDAGGLVMGYYDMHGTNAWRLAREFTLGDNMFHSAFGGSFLNHAFLVCSCAFTWPGAPQSIVAKLDAAGNLLKDGEVTPDGFVVNTSRSVYLHAKSDTDPALLVPPQAKPNIGSKLDAKGVSWKWYSGGYDDAMAGNPDPQFEYHHQPFAYFEEFAPGTPAQKAHLQDYNDLLRDLERNTLPQVAFYKPIGELNMHPGYASVTSGDAHLGEMVAKLQASPAYKDMLIVITYDENGGQWDHVAPPRRDRWGPGTRVPLVAVGPTVKRGFVDHTPYDFGSILKTIELRFGTDPVGAPDANAYPLRNLLQPLSPE